MNWICRDVPVRDRRHEGLSEPRVVEHVLHDHHAAGQVEEAQPDHLDGRRDGVRQRVDEQHPPPRHALELCHLHVVAFQRVDHRRPHHPEHVRHDHDDQGRHREHELFRVRPRRGARHEHRNRGEQVPYHRGEEDDQDHRHDELRQRGDGQCRDRQHVIEHAVPARRGEHAESHADQRADRAGQDHEDQRVQDPPADERAHRRPVGQRLAEVTVQDAGEPGPVLLDRRPVQAQLHLQRVQALRGRRVQQHRAGGVARQRLRRGEHQDRHQ